MARVYRLYVEKKEDFRVEAKMLLDELRDQLGLSNLDSVRVLTRYDIENIDERILEEAKTSVFSEVAIDYVYEETFPKNEDDFDFTVEYLPGQFDQR